MNEHYQGTILVVEDDAELRFILLSHLRSAGFRTFEAADGKEAVDTAKNTLPDVIIMDVGLPVMDGIAATNMLKQDRRTSEIPVIMLTARSQTADIVRGLEAGAQEYLAKPFDMMELLARVRTVHRLARTRGDLDRLNAQLEAEVDVKTRRLQILYDFMRDLNQSDTANHVLDLIMGCVVEMTGAERVSLLLKDADGENLVCRRAVGIDPAIVDNIRVKMIEGVAGQVIRSGKTLSARAFGPDQGTGRRYGRDEFVTTPLETPEGIIGVLNVTEKREDKPFSDDEIECIRSIADAAAIALDNITRRQQLQESVKVLLRTVGHLAEFRDEETTLHLERVSKMARILGNELGRDGPYTGELTSDFVDALVQAAPMHDIGKVGIPDEILAKPGKLTDEEFQIMKTHTDIGRRVLSLAVDPAHPVPLLQMCVDIAYCHHEKFNGKGYPRRLKGTEIPLAARIIALVDAYDAITSQRRYKRAKTHAEAVEIIRSESGEHFDPVVVDAFLHCEAAFNEVRARYDDSLEAVESFAR